MAIRFLWLDLSLKANIHLETPHISQLVESADLPVSELLYSFISREKLYELRQAVNRQPGYRLGNL